MAYPVGQAEGLQALADALRTAVSLAPFGDKPDATVPPFSVSQLHGYMSTGSATTMPTVRLERLCVHTLRDLEDRSRRGVERRVAALASIGPSPHEPWASMPRSLCEVLWMRHGPEALSRALTELPELSTDATLIDAIAAMRPLMRLSERLVHWEHCLGLEHELNDAGDGADAGGGDFGDGAGSWPNAESWRTLRRRATIACASARAAPSSLIAEHAAGGGGVPSAPPARLDAAGRFAQLGLTVRVDVVRRAPASAGSGGWWEARVRVECSGEARSISAVSVGEELHVGWPEALSALDGDLVVRLRRLASRDVQLVPPALLHGPGCYLELALKLARVADDVVPEAPPRLAVLEVVCP
jgi:hypothetical protein